jgi:hypothetical protein
MQGRRRPTRELWVLAHPNPLLWKLALGRADCCPSRKHPVCTQTGDLDASPRRELNMNLDSRTIQP